MKTLMFILILLANGGTTLEKEQFIETADIQFTRCKSDHSLWCLTNDQYIVIIQQLSARKECDE